MPENVQSLISHVGIIPPPPDAPGAVEMVWERAYRCECMVCTQPLEENTMLSVSQHGIFFVACSGACYSDYFVIQWLQEAYDDLIDKVKFRGGGLKDVPLDVPVNPQIESPKDEEGSPRNPEENDESEGSNGEVA
jgi:hypothetical protein